MPPPTKTQTAPAAPASKPQAAAPASTPSKPAAPPAAPTPPTPPAPTSSFRPLDDDLMAAATPAPKPTRPARKAVEPPKADPPPEADPAAPEAPPEQTPGHAGPTKTVEEDDYLMGSVASETGTDTKVGTDAPKVEEPAATGPLKAPELRNEYAKVKSRVIQLEKELTELKAKSTAAPPVDEPERKAFVEQISTLKKQLDDTTGALKTVAYEHSEEYKTKYEQPFADAWRDGVQLVSRLTLTDGEGQARKGTEQDFAAIMSIADDEKAAEVAQEMFGANAFYILAERRDIIKLHNARRRALDEHRTNLAQREKEQAEVAKREQEQREAQRIQAVTLFKKFNSEAVEKYPQYFAPIPGDDKGNELLDRGFKDADMAFTGAPELTPERRVQLHSAIRNRAAAFGRLVHQLKTKDAQIAELQKELSEIKGSTPGDGQVTRDDHGQKILTADEEIELAATKYR